MKSLSNRQDKQEVLDRLHQLKSESPRQWGRMTPHQMICHLSDAFRSAMNEKAIILEGNPLYQTVVKWIALQVPIPWPKGVKTRPEMDQEIGGTKPVDFERDKQELEMLVERFTAKERDFEWHAHSLFGRMTEKEWYRWGYLHLDHHLRQFGA
jgi:hypothetical protein